MSEATIPVSRKKFKKLQQRKREMEVALKKDVTWDQFLDEDKLYIL